jgi:FAD binding domain/Berberine and berberine like
MAIDLVKSTDERFADLNKGRNNGRFPTPEESASAIALCHSADDMATAVEQTIQAKARPTVRSGGHCYEGFVYNNPKGTVIDLREMNNVSIVPGTQTYKIDAGATVGDFYTGLHKLGGVTLPAATCTTVGSGGHISGGGYGLLSRMYGIAPDWVSAVDIVTVDAKGKVQLRHATKSKDADLLRACRGSGGGNYGIVSSFYFDKLPPAPKEVMSGRLTFAWDGMTPERLYRILDLYMNYWDTRGRDADTLGLFTILVISPPTATNARFGMSVQFCNPDGTANDTKVLDEFFAVFDECKPVSEIAHGTNTPGAEHLPDHSGPGELVCLAQHNVTKRPWIEAAVPVRGMRPGGGGAGGPAGGPRPLRRQMYKSAYMKKPFTREETDVFFKYMMDGSKYGLNATVAMDSFGGATSKPGILEETSDAHRSAILKMQFITGWSDPADDENRMNWMRGLYTDLFSASVDGKHKGTPYFSDRHEGCYINYPDADMTKYSFWPELYWGPGKLYPFLQHVKKTYDPSNVFHHAMSVRA